MTFKSYPIRLLLHVLFLFIALAATSFFLVRQWYVFLAVTIPVIAYAVFLLLRMQNKTHAEWSHFVEAIRYRDFSRHFDEKHAPVYLQSLRSGFNTINSTFVSISREKELQYQYLQKVLELVDTGILSYETESGEVIWMNDTLKRMLQLPYLKTIQSLQRRDALLFEAVQQLKPGEAKVATVQVTKNAFRVLLSATAFVAEGRQSKLIAFQNVNNALDETESKAWQKLLSVMTHEIMNSIAPISSLAETLKSRLAAPDGAMLEDLELGIETIRRRSEGLLKFAATYRNLNKITRPQLQRLYVRELFASLHRLMQPTFGQRNIELEIILREVEVTIEADSSLMEQLFINLLTNAIEAVKETTAPKITLSAVQEQNKILLKVTDNGPGIPDEILDKIFVPFFSTKKNGSGIGLSLCKQIMLLHNGTIQVQTAVGSGTSISLILPQAVSVVDLYKMSGTTV